MSFDKRGMNMGLIDELKRLPSYSEELGLNLFATEDRFKWFLASLLFAKRISSNIAKKTFRKFIEENLVSPDRILAAGWNRLVEVLDSGGYVRYDFSTATNILRTVKLLKSKYDGDLERLHKEALDPKDLEKRLMEFKGFGPTAVNIFLRELRGIWSKAQPKSSPIAIDVANRLNLKEVEKFEPKLVKLYLEYCKKNKCAKCPVKNYCKETKY